ncbi:hypothetical protein NK553_04105 [Pseudomonas sp. ZM23]|uniref:CDI immunity protein domain-containing protein n=1 Tax=Pseudomonas triclosanedens TaxID=2961893 RepID=A0ABY6ZXE3_9PSED|nr:hypothetical protein [Pseudomonas triclosanedens]MCP8463124.1 hypothetical protein [Pseudomonas triclosanedens]MCP8469817.1 hypothetical protein [Pseudomonas triclosanedens]MCP8473925.1 hypothetical protein [Pseudomonas triclosanedens]WAI48675.1 hypothetical protein OU419_23395 [Pseudomonas triclosanedens]
MSDLEWLGKLKERFSATGLEYEDLYELINASIVRNRISFPAFIYEASKGFGFSVGEGYFYALDQDWDDPDAFDEVSFFLGEVETSSISVFDYIALMKIAADVYSSNFPEEKDSVEISAKRLEDRYSKFSN